MVMYELAIKGLSNVEILLKLLNKQIIRFGGSPGLVVMGGDSCSEGRGFKSWRCIVDGHDIFHIDLL